MTTIKSNKAEQKMLREISMISVINMLFNILFVLLYIIPIPFNTRLVLVSVYNVLCSIPDVLIPLSVLIGSREVRLEIMDRFKTMIPSSRFSDTSIIKALREQYYTIVSLSNSLRVRTPVPV
ncbi:hypothetical protein Y032_0023g761 [Ancylostoma ceylanicum]|uniref:Uncharacterized protein n=1 Tax=Ancylostoma ceylanicum TaxID=53326 RepID=A0A016UYJ3_9BILA|nr:hypothetical protein Y032_0023g761 [Ancylostoma ceylanicum]